MSSPLKVLHVVLSMDVGGLERIVLSLVREGHRLGQRTAVACLERPGALAAQVEALGTPLFCVEKGPGVRLKTIGRLKAVLREVRPDVVHTHQIGALFYAGPAARSVGVPLIVHTEHGKHYGTRRRMRWLGWMAARYAARFFCVSADIAAEVMAYRITSPGKVHVVPNGIDPARFRGRDDREGVRRLLGIPGGTPVVGTIGRLSEVKRQDVLIRALARLRRQVPAAHLVLVGDGPLMGSLRELAVGLGLEGCVHFAGYQPEPERFLQAMDVFVLSSQSEGTPLAVLEAWAAALPVVGSRVGGLPELIDDGRTGVLFPPGDDGALAAVLGGLLTDLEHAYLMGLAGREQAEARFTVRHMMDVYQRHYGNLLVREQGVA
jgi:sugar transferase (PEP-CTERM/EpsH1 system associated)